MAIFILGLVLFLGAHSAHSLIPGVRQTVIEARGVGTWKGVAALASIIGLGLMIWGWLLYRPEAPEIFVPPGWGRSAADLLVPLGFICMAAAYAQPVGRIKATLQHPFVTGVALWALGHLLVNGDLASILLFGGFLVFTVVYRISVATRGGAPVAFASMRGDAIAVLAAAIGYALFYLGLHSLLFGVPLWVS